MGRKPRVWKLGMLGIVVLLLSAPVAHAERVNRGNYSSHCKRINKQIVRYNGDMKMARQRRNALWQRSIDEQIGRLEMRRARLCPEQEQAVAIARFRKLMNDTASTIKMGTEAAVAYFTGGF
jgi:hypothetical protein